MEAGGVGEETVRFMVISLFVSEKSAGGGCAEKTLCARYGMGPWCFNGPDERKVHSGGRCGVAGL